MARRRVERARVCVCLLPCNMSVHLISTNVEADGTFSGVHQSNDRLAEWCEHVKMFGSSFMISRNYSSPDAHAISGAGPSDLPIAVISG